MTEKLEEIGRYNDVIDFLFGKRLQNFGMKAGQKDDAGEGDMAGGEQQT